MHFYSDCRCGNYFEDSATYLHIPYGMLFTHSSTPFFMPAQIDVWPITWPGGRATLVLYTRMQSPLQIFYQLIYWHCLLLAFFGFTQH